MRTKNNDMCFCGLICSSFAFMLVILIRGNILICPDRKKSLCCLLLCHIYCTATSVQLGKDGDYGKYTMVKERFG